MQLSSFPYCQQLLNQARFHHFNRCLAVFISDNTEGFHCSLPDQEDLQGSFQDEHHRVLGLRNLPVRKPPGWMETTLTPHLESSILITDENMITAAFVEP